MIRIRIGPGPHGPYALLANVMAPAQSTPEPLTQLTDLVMPVMVAPAMIVPVAMIAMIAMVMPVAVAVPV